MKAARWSFALRAVLVVGALTMAAASATVACQRTPAASDTPAVALASPASPLAERIDRDRIVDLTRSMIRRLHVEVERIGAQIVPYHYWDGLTEDDPLIATIFQVAPSFTGRRPEWRMSAGGGRPDLWQLGAKWISFSITKGEGAHGADEWVEIESLAKHARFYSDLVLRMLR